MLKCVEMCSNERSAAANAPAGDPKNITSISTLHTLRFTLLHSNSEMPWQGSETNLEFDLRYCASSTYIVFSAAVGQFYSTFEI